MKIAIISDIHDNLVNLKKSLDYINKWRAEQIICCGDVCNLDTIDYLIKNFSGIIHLVRGNMELFEDDDLPQIDKLKYYGKIALEEMAGRQVGLCHEPFRIDDILKMGKAGIIFHGHTHKPWIEKKDNLLIANPGNVAGILHKATFAVWNTEDKRLKLVVVDEI
ncbi:MAG: metallophosphoesterase family protein [Patescibacteria group bacterium]|nr:metallophosphoesterase family protein [Patescibacteria group bacterium]